MPPESWCGYSLSRRFGSGMPTRFSRSTAAADAVFALEALVPRQYLGDLDADRHDRVERGHRILENHGDVLATDVAHPVLGKGEQVVAVEPDLATDPYPSVWKQTHDRE